MKKLILIWMCICPLLVYSQECADRELIPINETAKAYIEENFKSSRIADTSNFISDWCSFYDEDEVPYYQEGDFNGDGKTDYALMLYSENNFMIVMLHNEGANKYSHHILTEEKSDGLNYMISKIELEIGFGIQPPGELYDFDTDTTINISTNSLIVYFFEKGAESYYWKDNKYNRIHSGD